MLSKTAGLLDGECTGRLVAIKQIGWTDMLGNILLMVIFMFFVNEGHVCVSVFTAEQFQEHQEQLALMQKQQLEQIQQQASDTTTTQVCLSKRQTYM